jgi:anti-anti-sigma factor
MSFVSSIDTRIENHNRPRVQTVPDGDAAPVRIVALGELDGESAAPLQQAVTEILRRQRPDRIDVDVSGVTFLDTGGIWALIECQADAHQLESSIRLTNPHPMVYRVLHIVRMLEHFSVTEHPPGFELTRLE